jgi:hypothetical protein
METTPLVHLSNRVDLLSIELAICNPAESKLLVEDA